MPYTTFKQGIRDCLPTVLGYAGVGFSFGIVSVASGFNILEILLLSLLVYAGQHNLLLLRSLPYKRRSGSLCSLR